MRYVLNRVRAYMITLRSKNKYIIKILVASASLISVFQQQNDDTCGKSQPSKKVETVKRNYHTEIKFQPRG